MKALIIEPPPSATTLVRPNRMMEKYSGESNLSAKLAKECAIATAASVETRPPVSAASKVQPSAFAGWPLCAMA